MRDRDEGHGVEEDWAFVDVSDATIHDHTARGIATAGGTVVAVGADVERNGRGGAAIGHNGILQAGGALFADNQGEGVRCDTGAYVYLFDAEIRASAQSGIYGEAGCNVFGSAHLVGNAVGIQLDSFSTVTAEGTTFGGNTTDVLTCNGADAIVAPTTCP